MEVIHGPDAATDNGQHLAVGGCPVWFRDPGPGGSAGARCLLLVHGSGANHAWWSQMVPLLEQRYRVVLMDLSGHGDSGHRADRRYDVASWAQEVVSVIEHLDTPVTLVGHSMGGTVCLQVAESAPDLVAGVVTFDTFGLAESDLEHMVPQPPGKQKYYATPEELVERFTLSPPQPRPEPGSAVLRDLALASIRHTDHGWTWKADMAREVQPAATPMLYRIDKVACPVLFVRAGLGVFQSPGELTATHLASDAGEVTLPGVHHHLLLESPAECVAQVDALVART